MEGSVDRRRVIDFRGSIFVGGVPQPGRSLCGGAFDGGGGANPKEWCGGSREPLLWQARADLSHKGRAQYFLRPDGNAVVTDGPHRRLLPVGAAAEYLGVSRATVERLVYRGELPIVKISGATRYDLDDLDRFIEQNRQHNRRRMSA